MVASPVVEELAGVRPIRAILTLDPSSLYRRRAARLRKLADGHVAGRYLGFAATLAEIQDQIVAQKPLQSGRLINTREPIDRMTQADLLRDAGLPGVLATIATGLINYPEDMVRLSAKEALALDPVEATTCVVRLQRGEFSTVDARHASLLWAALGLLWSQSAARHGQDARLQAADTFCPVCGAPPVGSVIMDGAQAGLRYLHCSLCESRWHRVRARCSNCDDPRPTELWSLEGVMPAIQAECCDACGSYLKRFNCEVDRELEIVADDLASLDIDALIDARGFGRTGVNPLSLPSVSTYFR
ncbi:MAG TPA: formate dehydrogenase accessory protein FdhE [Afipia sp.]